MEIVREARASDPSALVRERVKQLLDSGTYSQTEIAAGINYSASAFSSWSGGKYRARSEKMELALYAWLRKHELLHDDHDMPAQYIETTAANQAMEVIDIAHEQGVITAAVGRPGVGKSQGLREWERRARQAKIRYISVTCHVGMRSQVPILRKICDGLRINSRGVCYALMDRIFDKLKSDPTVLIIDEAQQLGLTALEALRAIWDETHTGIALLGSQAFFRLLRDGDRSHIELQQLQDRLHVIVTLKAMTQTEHKRFANQYWRAPLEDDVITRLRGRSHGIPRRVARILTHARQLCEEKKSPLTAEIVEEASRLLFNKEEL